MNSYEPHASNDDTSQPAEPTDDTWLVGYRINRINSTVLLGGFNPALTDVLKNRRWATLIRDQGWAIPLRYLAHVERLLTGADVTLFDTEGAPTPGQRERTDDRTANQRVFDELHAARQAAERNPAAVAAARAEARRAFAHAIAASPTIDHTGNEAVS